MSGSPAVALRRLQRAVHAATGCHVSSLALSSALLRAMESRILHFDRSSLESHLARLRNWQLADSIIIAAWNRERENLAGCPLRLIRLDMPALYQTYLERAKVAGVAEPFAYTTFRIRAYELPLSSLGPAAPDPLDA